MVEFIKYLLGWRSGVVGAMVILLTGCSVFKSTVEENLSATQIDLKNKVVVYEFNNDGNPRLVNRGSCSISYSNPKTVNEFRGSMKMTGYCTDVTVEAEGAASMDTADQAVEATTKKAETGAGAIEGVVDALSKTGF